MPNFLSQAIVVLGGIFATNLGAVIGVEVDQGAGIGFKALEFSRRGNNDIPYGMCLFLCIYNAYHCNLLGHIKILK